MSSGEEMENKMEVVSRTGKGNPKAGLENNRRRETTENAKKKETPETQKETPKHLKPNISYLKET